jgi:hypothetical protein
MTGKRDPYVSKAERRRRAWLKGPGNAALNGATEEYHRLRNMKGDAIWECECGCELKENPRNPAMGFDNWSGNLVCPVCNRNMTRKE